MEIRTWHPYAPDQAFGQQAARDEELVDSILARLDGQQRPAPRAGCKAAPPAASAVVGWPATDQQMVWLASGADLEPVTTATALEAAALLLAD
ncbi:MAG: hypothetical protein QOJ09_2751 [Actinomycetota bacterium]|jgi:hypothetical protein|nr:hypothetical protein [Actinomycetota bacterium]